MLQPRWSAGSGSRFERGSDRIVRGVGGSLVALGAGLISLVILSATSFAQAAPPSVPDVTMGSLSAVALQKPDLSQFIADEQAAVQLGKAFFWDMQMGSDGVTACASCHYQAGADVRTKNTLNPGMAGGDITFQLGGPNYQLVQGDFPFHRYLEPANNQSSATFDKNEVVGAAGVFARDFKAPGIPGTVTKGEDVCTTIAGDVPFTVGGINTRRVTGRNAPSVINAAFNFRNFWDGRANNNFNGVNPFGDRDPNAVIFKNVLGSNTPQPVKVSISFSSLASQAVGPPGSPFEMSCDGRIFPNMGRKMLTVVPLGQQLVDANDSMLGPLANSVNTPGARGLNTTYSQLIQRAFRPEYWQSGGVITIDASTAVTASMLRDDFFALVGGKVIEPLMARDEKRVIIPANRYTQMEANFSLFWGLAIQLYEDTLIANDSPVDRYLAGNLSALTAPQVDGLSIFQNQGRCINCHGGAETTNASIRKVTNERLERMITGNGSVGVYDDGFYNIGVRPTTNDLGIGGKDPFGNPLSEVGLCQQQLAAGNTCDASILNIVARPLEGIDAGQLTASERKVVNGAFKVPGLRNVELTGPYFHNGGQATLRQVVDFYDRGGDFANQNLADLDTDIARIGLTEDQKKHLVEFLIALTDDRVKYEKAPFDHPSLCIPDGHPGTTTSVSDDRLHRGQATDNMKCFPAVGEYGHSDALTPFLGLDPQTP